MFKTRRIVFLCMVFLLMMQVVLASPADTNVQKIRYSNTAEKVRIVFEVDKLPVYSARLQDNPAAITIEFNRTGNNSNIEKLTFQDAMVNNLLLQGSENKLQAVINLKSVLRYKIFTLANPNRIVIDIYKGPQKTEKKVAPGILYTMLSDTLADGPFLAHIVSIDLQQGYQIKPVLSNDAIRGLETVESMADRSGALAAINGSYFGPNGEIIGLMKLSGEFVSIPELPRTTLGILPEGKLIIDTTTYSGSVDWKDGSVNIDGVNCERGPDSLILYNHYFDKTTRTNEFGVEYVIKEGKVVASYVNQGSAEITAGTVVISAHGKAAQALAGLKVGDKVTINQTLGPLWDKTIHVLGAGPLLVKNNVVNVTSRAEEFPADISVGRAPRTAVGISAEGRIFFVVIDGRQNGSIGMTLGELAKFMQQQGAVTAMNFDGGGSSEMVVKDMVVNSPSDGCERYVGSALVVTQR